MAFHSTYTCPPGMTDALFQRCADWATRMDRAVMYREPVPMEEPPVLYDTFRRVNSQCIDPVLAVSFQRHQRNAELARAARESYGPPATPAAASPMVPLDAVSLMFEVTQSLVDSAQREGRWQAQNTIQALTRLTSSSAPTRGYQQRARNRQYRAPNIAPYRPRNFDHIDREPERAPHGPRGRRARFSQDDPPSYRRDRRPFEPTSPAAGPPRATPHPHVDFLFRGVPDEDHVMRDETPAPAPDPLAVTPRPIINTIDLRTPEPIIIDDSERGTQGTNTPRAQTPASVIEPVGEEREVIAFQPHAVMDAFPSATRITPAGFPADTSSEVGPVAGPSTRPLEVPAVPANSEYAGSVTDEFEQLDLGAADQLLTEYLNKEILEPLAMAFP